LDHQNEPSNQPPPNGNGAGPTGQQGRSFGESFYDKAENRHRAHKNLDEHIWHNVHPWTRLKGFLAPESSDMWIIVIYSLAIGLVTLVLPVATQALVNTIAFGTLVQPLVALTVLVFIALSFNTVMNAYRLWVVEVMQRRIFVRIAGDTTMRLVKVRPEAFDRYHGPELVNRFLDVVTVQKAASTLLVDGLSVAFQTLIGMILLAIYHPFLLVFDVVLVIFILLVLFPMSAGAIPTAIKESKSKYAMMAWLEEIARHQVAFKTRAGSIFGMEQTNNLVITYLTYRAKHFRILLRQILGMYTIQAIAFSVLLGGGGWLVINRQLTLGQLVAAEIVVALVVSGFTKFGKHLETFYDMMTAIDKLGYLEDLPTERTGGESLPRLNRGAALRIHDVSMGYTQNRRLLETVNFEIPAGGRVGIVGPTGCGKSTLLDLIYALREPAEGLIEIDGLDYRDVRLNELRSQIALVRQPEIFEGTILDNLRLGLEHQLDIAQAREALAEVGLIEDVVAFPQGIQTPLSTGGQPLSPGQRVQLEIARAILRRPRVLILDECLDHLDDLPGREELYNRLFGRDMPWTLIVTSQNPEILGRCDSVFEMSDRKVRPLGA
jgi:putative ABC transport system ATP-binding protein